MKKIIHVNSKTKQVEHTHFSGKHKDIFELVGKNTDNLTALRVQSPSGKQFNIFFDKDQDMHKHKDYVVFGGTMIWGNMVVASLTSDQSEFNNVSKEDLKTMESLFQFD